jgi:hypothetical protein
MTQENHTTPATTEPKQGYIAFWKGKHLALSAASRDEAWEIAGKHFGVIPSKRWQIHLEDAPLDGGSNI